jgi:hypothetical protein
MSPEKKEPFLTAAAAVILMTAAGCLAGKLQKNSGKKDQK